MENTAEKVSMLPPGAPKSISFKPSIALFVDLIGKSYAGKLRYNVMTGKPELLEDGAWRNWTDADTSGLMMQFQDEYGGLYHMNMTKQALDVWFEDHKVNPLTDMIDAIEWDGKSRVDTFLRDTLKVKDSDYTRECSRLIFAGGIHRAYHPGCKVDVTVVLIGEQGCGKSTIARYLAMDDMFHRVISTIEGKEGVEILKGVWIGEIAELMAMTKVKEIEKVKAFLTEQRDDYRPPYGKFVQTFERRCVFIGTTNNEQFLTDKTGNRRFLPVKCWRTREEGAEIVAHEKEIRAHIAQCWAEARERMKRGEFSPHPDRKIMKKIVEAQEAAMEDDYRVGLIYEYLKAKRPGTCVCALELWREALEHKEDRRDMSPLDQKEIRQIVANMPDWERRGSQWVTGYGQQRVWVKREPDKVEEIFQGVK